ncbi:putative beta-lysine N-acetyltransferase [Oleidesulfovibrio sp.]|uniref:putative beta-lysine N-acetyltransferase n=1 Tax=Oleidesulfovibrio sp. TaxID=2909707 RepID=UPI003A8B346D
MQSTLTEFVAEPSPELVTTTVQPDTLQPDSIEQIGRSVLQHGPLNDRVYLMKVDPADAQRLMKAVYELAEANGYSKLFAKVPQDVIPLFTQHGFTKEACVPRMQNGKKDICFMSRFLRLWRQQPDTPKKIHQALQIAKAKGYQKPPALTGGYTLHEMQPKHTEEMAKLYDTVFPSYPFPINDSEYLCDCMKDNVRFFGAMQKGRIVALASAEMDAAHANAEMTDFATLPKHRGKRLARHLLHHMEQCLLQSGFQTAFTIARAVSIGMNATFARSGFDFAGTLVNNTNISGKIESMNVWHKSLA